MSLGKRWRTGLAVGGALLFTASCGDGPTVPPDHGEVGPVLGKGGPKGPQLREVDVAIPTETPYGPNGLIGDGLELTGGLYVGGECGVVALAGSSFSFFPFYGGMNKKELRDFNENAPCGRDDEGNAIRRQVRVDLASATVHTPGHVDEVSFAAAGLPDVGTDEDLMNHAKVSGFDHDGSSSGSFGVPYCNYLTFNTDGAPDTDSLVVTTGNGTVRVETRAYPDNVGECAYDRGVDPPLVVLLHLDIAYDVMEK